MIILGYYPVADLGEARPPTLFLDQMETAPALSQGLDDRLPPPPRPLSEGLDPPLLSIH